jgi:uncharacterized ferritin-like protein (DUF455 family)
LNLSEFAENILYGTTIEDKCTRPSLIDNANLEDLSNRTIQALQQAPLFPGRPSELVKKGKASFPALARLHEDLVRGEVLHFFANHELLAIELMALVILKFPDAPPSFLNGVVATIQEEQNHLRLYMERMKELGVRFGDLPVSDFFWKCLSPMKSPMDFVVQMGMTFEQANLDFALFYMKAIERVGDAKTAAILERVYREEIGHVKNGVYWFNRLREMPETESDWDAYVRLLPTPLNPRRAKGLEFCAEARRQAGLSDTYIHELEIYSGSKGRPSILWLYNPSCDLEIARGKPGYTPTAGSQRLMHDLESLPMFLALDKDLVLVEHKPRSDWIASIQKCGFKTPEFLVKKKSVEDSVRITKIGGFEPWGWSPDTFEAFRPMKSRIVRVSAGNGLWCEKILGLKSYAQTGLGPLFSKSWSVQFLKEWMTSAPPESSEHFGPLEIVGCSFESWESAELRLREILGAQKTAMVKAPYGTAGTQVRHLCNVEELQGKMGGWIRNVLRSQGAIIVEEYLDQVYDLSVQLDVRDEGVEILGVRRFITGRQNEYRGTYLGKKLTGFAEADLRSIHALLSQWRPFIVALGKRLREEGYRGPAGVDALLWRDLKGCLKLKPLIELNPRWTMGRVALELEKSLKPGVQGLWAFLPIREIKKLGYENVQSFVRAWTEKYPLQLAEVGGGQQRIESGVVFTNDPVYAREVLTILAVLPETELADLSLMLVNKVI